MTLAEQDAFKKFFPNIKNIILTDKNDMEIKGMPPLTKANFCQKLGLPPPSLQRFSMFVVKKSLTDSGEVVDHLPLRNSIKQEINAL